MENRLGVFFTCYTEEEAVKYSIDKLKEVYPNIPVYLVSDGGSNFSSIKEKYKDIETKLEKDSRGILMNLKNIPEEKEEVMDSIFTFLRRINESIDFCKSKFLLIMESDILVRGNLNIPEDSILLGSKINPWIHKEDEVNVILSKYGGSSVHGYGCTPVIFRSDIFQEIYQTIVKNPSIISDLCDVTYQVAMYDVLIPIVFALKGHSEEFNPDIMECLRTPNWESLPNPLVHQFRKYYPRFNYDGIHAGENF
jgi:hypothetical protein